MNNFLKTPRKNREDIFTQTAIKMGIAAAIVEKDFWVSWVLDYLFSDFECSKYFVFKGGTSLSKSFHLINRFSEDIDLILDWETIGIEKNQPYIPRSNTKQISYNKFVTEQTEEFLSNVLLPMLTKGFKGKINDEFELYISQKDKQTLRFVYPRTFFDASILQEIHLEIGALGEPVPYELVQITPYIKEVFPSLLLTGAKNVRSLSPMRTFYEKLTILHREVKRTNGNYPTRYSRHFFDVYQLIESNIGIAAFESINLLIQVIEFKKKFYSCNWADYDEIYKGKLKLVPNNEAIAYFNKDYKEMRSMLFGDVPTFDEIIYCLSNYEKKVNQAILNKAKID